MSDSLRERLAARLYVAMHAGQEAEAGEWRFKRFAEGVKVTHLANAGKRGKKCAVFFVNDEGSHVDHSENLLALARKGASLAQMKAAIDALAAEGASVEVDEVKGVDVTPAGFEPLLVRGALVTIESSYDDFTVKDIVDDRNEPTCMAKGKKDVKLFYRFVKDNAQKLQSMAFKDVLDAMRQAGIGYHYFCAMD